MTKATNYVSSLAAQATNELRDIKPPVDVPNPWLWVWIGLGLLGVIAAVVAIAALLRKRRREAPLPPPIPAHIRARQHLQDALALIGNPREFCIRVSDAIRFYLEERFNFRAPERTTEEFLHELQATNLLTPDQKASLGEFLQRCDLVKFARYEPGEPELRDLHAAALRLVDETAPQETAPPEAATPERGTPNAD
jgi:hypothetical protein